MTVFMILVSLLWGALVVQRVGRGEGLQLDALKVVG